MSGRRMSLECVVSFVLLRNVFSMKVAIMIAAKAASSSESVYNVKKY